MKTRAFTLVELSIVLLIIGLIIGGITAGASLIKQAQLRAVISEFSNIQSSITTFKIQFNYLPGDFPGAGSFWASATCANSAVTAGCNGNGDDVVTTSVSSGDETSRFFQHMSLAGVINGNFNATYNASDRYPSKYPSGVYNVRNVSPWAGYNNYNFLELGVWNSRCPCNGLLAPIDAYNIDLKIDDGLANSGNLFGSDGDTTTANYCSYAWASGVSTAAYNLSGTGSTYPGCRIMKILY